MKQLRLQLLTLRLVPQIRELMRVDCQIVELSVGPIVVDYNLVSLFDEAQLHEWAVSGSELYQGPISDRAGRVFPGLLLIQALHPGQSIDACCRQAGGRDVYQALQGAASSAGCSVLRVADQERHLLNIFIGWNPLTPQPVVSEVITEIGSAHNQGIVGNSPVALYDTSVQCGRALGDQLRGAEVDLKQTDP